MRGNSPVRFLGEGMAVTLFPYPTKILVRAEPQDFRRNPGVSSQ